MNKGYLKYRPFVPLDIKDRKWVNNTIKKAPIWCSVDLRDGNQALVNPMNFTQKLEFFKLLTAIGIKEIEIGFPSSSETEYDILRALIERNLIPNDVTIQVLVQCREHLIRRTFEAIDGAKNIILHFYNSTSTIQREVVFASDKDGVEKIALESAKLIKTLGDAAIADGMNLRYEYSPESFTATELDYAVDICEKVMNELGATPQSKVIINLPATVEIATPNCYADQIEYFCSHLKNRESAIISLHPHNDRGTGIAATELGIMAGADRVEGTLFGNGERTGNADIINLALNMHTQGIDCKLDLSDIPKIRKIYEDATSMRIYERQPYAGDLVFTAFSGSHQDAIKKGLKHIKDVNSAYWDVPYLPIDPADIGRAYEPIIRINSQSGKGGASFVMENDYGYIIPKKMQPEFGAIIKAKCVSLGRELAKNEIFDIFNEEYVKIHQPYSIVSQKIRFKDGQDTVEYVGTIKGKELYEIKGVGNGPIDAFFKALKCIGIEDYKFVSYNEHADSVGSDAKAIAYIEIMNQNGESIFGVGIDSSINMASIKGILSAINRAIKVEQQE